MTKKVEVVVEEDVNATAMEGLLANITKEPQFVIKKSLQFKSGMNVLGLYHITKSDSHKTVLSDFNSPSCPLSLSNSHNCVTFPHRSDWFFYCIWHLHGQDGRAGQIDD